MKILIKYLFIFLDNQSNPSTKIIPITEITTFNELLAKNDFIPTSANNSIRR